MKTLVDREDLVFSPPALGCVLYLPGLPGGGSKIYDRSPYGNIGTITGATWKRLPSGLWCLDFDGTDDYIDCDNIVPINAAQTDFTIMLWVWTTAATVSPLYTYNADDTLNPAGDFYLMKPSSLIVGGFGESGQNVDTGIDVHDGVWHLVTVSLGSTAWNLYVDDALAHGPEAQAGDQAAFSTSHKFRLANKLNQPAWYAGDIGKVCIYNRALSALEILNIFLREKHLFGVW